MSYFVKSAMMIAILGLMVASGLMWLQQPSNAEGPPAASGPPQAMPVIAKPATSKTLQLWSNFSARLSAVDEAELRPQVSGVIEKVNVQDGQFVKKGTTLFVIDQRLFRAALQQARAELAAAQNRYSLAKLELDRARGLIRTQAISQRIYDERSNTAQVALADIDRAKAGVATARVNLDYTTIQAPFDGRIGRIEITQGNLVEAGPNAPVLTRIVSNASIYADFEVDERTYLQQIRSASTDNSGQDVELILQDGDMVVKGAIHSFDNQLDASSGTIRARAKFDNADGRLLPGMFANIRLSGGGEETYITVPERAIGTDQDRRFVYVINNQGMVEYRSVQLGNSEAGLRIIREGLSEGEMVITEGIIRIRPGMPVTVKPQDETQPRQAKGA